MFMKNRSLWTLTLSAHHAIDSRRQPSRPPHPKAKPTQRDAGGFSCIVQDMSSHHNVVLSSLHPIRAFADNNRHSRRRMNLDATSALDSTQSFCRGGDREAGQRS
jgi:hypothetical protein